ncbi:MAG: DNA repair protein RecN [Burkholderiaceae bacterium]|jgi:DNA repair protein RecN (Recombination protein N)|nr:DNA repair protein RecN [Burkholderiaceae bacterium]
MPLRHLVLRDFVIVDALEFSPGEGFTVLTGETGAGKSILVDALQLLLGARADALYVREGQARCELSAEFDPAPPALAWLAEQGLDADGGEPLLLRRTIDRGGKSRAWINGSPATVGQLRELGDLLVDIHGQHDWQSLTRAAAVRALLDAYGGIATAALTQAWQNWHSAEAELAQARAAQETLAQERERLSWQLDEIGKLAPAAGEWAELTARHERLSHAQALAEAAQTAAQALDDDEGGALAQLALAEQRLAQWAQIEPEFAAIGQVLASGSAVARDAAHSLRAWLRHAEPDDPQTLARLDERLAAWHALARRLRRPPEELPALQESWRAELAQLETRADLHALQTRAADAQAAYMAEAQSVSRQRRRAAPQLAAQVTQAMQGLGMEGGRFEVALDPGAPAAHGLEQAQFQVAGHAGASVRPVERVASGGELSRIALAIAVVTSRLGQTGTLVFDEVDAGIGGAVATTVGRLLRQLGADRQVLCVTHLPQVAACADAHWQVSKRATSEGALSAIAALQGPQRVQEIARMLGAHSGAGHAHAAEMLQAAAQPLAATPRPLAAKAKAR